MTNQTSPLSITEAFPLNEEKHPAALSPEQIHLLTENAREVLSAVITLEQVAGEKSDIAIKSDQPEIYRLEQKLDFITELLTKVIAAQNGAPAKSLVTLNALTVSWETSLTLSEGEDLTLSLSISPRYPLPMTLPVRVSTNEKGQITANILFDDDDAVDDLTRLVFLIHRRQIARKRTARAGAVLG